MEQQQHPQHLIVLVNGLWGWQRDWTQMKRALDAANEQQGCGWLVHVSAANVGAQTYQGGCTSVLHKAAAAAAQTGNYVCRHAVCLCLSARAWAKQQKGGRCGSTVEGVGKGEVHGCHFSDEGGWHTVTTLYGKRVQALHSTAAMTPHRL